jgi:hypothetical protein
MKTKFVLQLTCFASSLKFRQSVTKGIVKVHVAGHPSVDPVLGQVQLPQGGWIGARGPNFGKPSETTKSKRGYERTDMMPSRIKRKISAYPLTERFKRWRLTARQASPFGTFRNELCDKFRFVICETFPDMSPAPQTGSSCISTLVLQRL